MQNPPIGPGEPFQLLFNDLPAGKPSLPAEFRDIYPSEPQMEVI